MMNNIFLNKLRNAAFWFLDTLNGGPIKKELQDIQHSHSLPSFELLQKKNEERLKHLLDTVVDHSFYYQDFKGYESLEDFPVMNKNSIKENLDALEIRSPQKNKVHTVFTSGSTGTPFMIRHTQQKKHRNTADTLYFAGRAGFTLGDKLLYVRQWNKKLRKGKIKAFLQNIEQIEVDDLTPTYIENVLQRLQKDKSPKGWLGYPSALEKICDHLDNIKSRPLECNIKSIIGMSENLPGHVRSRMWYYFNTPMVSRYSNFENGIIAQQDTHSDHFVVNWASYIVEILDFEKDTPVREGELGRIVVTDLFNFATPMIRYDTGDVGAMIHSNAHPFPVLKTVEGRKTDILINTEGKMISPYAFMSILIDFSEINQVQYIQIDKKQYTIKINTKVPFRKEAKFVEAFKSIVGKSAEVSVEYVDQIPLLSSKKRKLTRNLFHENLGRYERSHT